jgi:hypothetical protein
MLCKDYIKRVMCCNCEGYFLGVKTYLPRLGALTSPPHLGTISMSQLTFEDALSNYMVKSLDNSVTSSTYNVTSSTYKI